MSLPTLADGLSWNTNTLATNGTLAVRWNTYTLTYTADTNGTIGGMSPQTVNHGANGTAVTAVADPGYQFADWSDSLTANPRSDLNVTSNLTVTARFAPVAPPVILPGVDVAEGNFRFQFSGTLGQHYRVEHTSILPAPSPWPVLTDIVSLAVSPFAVSDPATNAQGFYRVVFLP